MSDASTWVTAPLGPHPNYEKIKDNTTPIDLKGLVCHQSCMALCSECYFIIQNRTIRRMILFSSEKLIKELIFLLIDHLNTNEKRLSNKLRKHADKVIGRWIVNWSRNKHINQFVQRKLIFKVCFHPIVLRRDLIEQQKQGHIVVTESDTTQL